MPNPVSVNFSIYLLPWPPDQTFGDCEIAHELLLPLEQLNMGKEQELGAAGRNLVLEHHPGLEGGTYRRLFWAP